MPLAILTYTTRRHGPYLDIEFNRAPSMKVRDKLRAAGFTFRDEIRSWRGTRNHEYALLVAREAVEASEKASRRKETDGTLCVGCRHAAKGYASPCPWAREFQPVPGWTAEPTERSVTHGNRYHTWTVKEASFCVQACPLFAPDPPRRRRQPNVR